MPFAKPTGTVQSMCGRYASSRSAADLAALFDLVDETDDQLVADYNLAPTDPAGIVRVSARTPTPVLSVARWGLVPAWSRDASGAARMINARSETVVTSKAFGRPFAERRCLVPADGWYEWRRTPEGKRPYFMHRGDEPLMFGGIWTTWTAAGDDSPLLTFSILTLPARGKLTFVHDRMPLVLAPRQWQEWLHGPDPVALLAAPAVSYVDGIQLRPVSTAVSNVRNDGPELVREVPEESIVEAPPTLF